MDLKAKPLVLAAVTGGVVVFFAYKCLKTRGKKRKPCPPDTVMLYQIGRGPAAPSISPFPLKLETFLRMAEITYQSNHSSQFSSKGKTPWIEYNGEEVADSQLCIEFLKKKLNVDVNQHLTQEERAIARAFLRLTEENLYWAGALERWVFDTSFVRKIFSWWIVRSFQPIIKKEAWGHGMGRHTREEIVEIATADIKAISVFLADKKFLFGDKPCEEDCAIFGLLAQIYWHHPDSYMGQLIKGSYSNLETYCDRMKEKFWPDWDDCITDWGKRKPLK